MTTPTLGSNKLTTADAVRALQKLRLSSSAAIVAAHLGTTSRAVATALRSAVADGRVRRRFTKGIAWYRFVRLTAKPLPTTPTKEPT